MQRPSENVVVTGASAGVGRATVRRFAREGAHIALIARGEDGLRAAQREVEAAGGMALVLATDVANAKEVEAAAAAENEFGPIDIWVNDAMATIFSPFLEVTADEYHRATEVTYLGYVYGTMSALKRNAPKEQRDGGAGGLCACIPIHSASVGFCGAKAAIRGFTDSSRTELLHAKSDVHLTMVQMPALNTPQFDWCKSHLPRHPQPVPPIYQPEIAAEAIYWAAHHRRREVWVGSSTIGAILANKVVPGLMDRYLARTGFRSQQTDEPVAAGRPNNLSAPLAGDHGAHGRFDARAAAHSPELWAATHRSILWLAIGAGLGLSAIRVIRDMSQPG